MWYELILCLGSTLKLLKSARRANMLPPDPCLKKERETREGKAAKSSNHMNNSYECAGTFYLEENIVTTFSSSSK